MAPDQDNLINCKMHLKIVSCNPHHHCHHRAGIRPVISAFSRLIVMLAVLAGCASQPATQRPGVEDRQVIQEQLRASSGYPITEDDRATPYSEQRYRIERAEYYGRLADDRGSQAVGESIDAALSAAEFYIQANDTVRASQSIERLDSRQFSAQQRNRYEIILAYTDYARREYRVALNRLQNLLNRVRTQSAIDVGEGSNRQLVDAMLLGSFCYQELGEHGSAVALLIEREALLFGVARAETSRYIWQVINNLSIEQRQEVIQSTANPLVRNRFEQSLQGQVAIASTAPNQFDKWRDNTPVDKKTLVDEQWSADTPKAIAVLLPITSRFNKAALAVKDGIEYQHSLNLSPYRPRIDFYDLGSNPLQASQYYAAARQNGADFIIGPLGTEYANQITASAADYQIDPVSGYGNQEYQLPTILLGGDQPLVDRFSRLSMSPERQAKIVADRAKALGYVNAALLIPADETGARTAQAFTRYWLGHGGKLSNSVSYSTTQFDHSTELKQLFNINHSEYRHKQLSNTLGYKPEFEAYRRNDIDFIFMIADNDAGRIVRPQINFFSGAKIPVLATASVYNGIPDATNDVDLEQTAFPVMPWVLRSSEVAPYAGQLNMLFAMGSDAYRLGTYLTRMQRNPSLALQGYMGELTVETSGEITYQPLWAQFENGIAKTDSRLLPLTDPFMIPGRTDQENRSSRQNGERRYDESNWDHRQSRRKPGS